MLQSIPFGFCPCRQPPRFGSKVVNDACDSLHCVTGLGLLFVTSSGGPVQAPSSVTPPMIDPHRCSLPVRMLFLSPGARGSMSPEVGDAPCAPHDVRPRRQSS